MFKNLPIWAQVLIIVGIIIILVVIVAIGIIVSTIRKVGSHNEEEWFPGSKKEAEDRFKEDK